MCMKLNLTKWLKMRTATINLYNINELSKDAKDFAVGEHKDFLMSVYSDSDFDECFKMTRSKYEKSLTKKYIIEDILDNDYLFFRDGTLAYITHYCGKHEKAGITEFKFKNEVYILK